VKVDKSENQKLLHSKAIEFEDYTLREMDIVFEKQETETFIEVDILSGNQLNKFKTKVRLSLI
jgi:hypothetical protein